MAKYLYKTVYEEFTGEKPPEPEVERETQPRRRGHGHPYRMRHNMQTEQANNSSPRSPQFGGAAKAQPSMDHQNDIDAQCNGNVSHGNFEQQQDYNAAPKAVVTYKKRRKFEPSQEQHVGVYQAPHSYSNN